VKDPNELQPLFGAQFDPETSFVLTIAGDGAVTWASDALLKVLGYSRTDAEHAKVDWDKTMPPEYWLLDDHRLGQLTRGNVADPSVIELFHADGSRIAFRVHSARSVSDRALVIALLTQLVEQRPK
jgi:PAS domain-containing protein